MNKTITELEQEFNQLMSNYGARYGVFSNCQTSRGIIYGRHITVIFPRGLHISKKAVEEVRKAVTTYYGEVIKVRRGTFELNSNEVVYILEA